MQHTTGKYTLHAQGKIANTMTMQGQIEMSGLEIMNSLSSSSSSSSQLQWNSTNQWSPLLGGGREFQACVTIESGNENGAGGQTIVVIGGQMQSDLFTNSVIVWDPSTKRWRNGPSLNDKRRDLVAVVCRDKVYAIGGWGGSNIDNCTTLDTIESIQVSSLLETTETSTTTRQNNNQWTRLQCHLSSPRSKCAAVVVHNRYIVILGGDTGMMCQLLSSVDILDTAPPQNNNNNCNGEATIVVGPSMNLARYAFGAAVVDNQIFVVGGYVNGRPSTSVESLLFQWQPQDKYHSNGNSNVSRTFANSSWRVERRLSLCIPRGSHAVAKVGSCLVVAGGSTPDPIWGTTSVEVLDVQRGVVWSLPYLTIRREYGCSMVTLSDCLLVLGGDDSEDCMESLALSVSRKHERCFKFLKFLIEIEFLGRSTTNLQFPMRLTGNGKQICCCCLS